MPGEYPGMLQAVLAVFTRIDLQGKPIPGPKNRFYTDSLVSVSMTAAYNKQDDISVMNGAGIICTTYSPPQTLLRLDVGEIAFCFPDPEAIEFLAGGVIMRDEDDEWDGYAAPPVGADPKPQGVAMEFYSSQIYQGAIIGYWHWLLPRVKLQWTKDQELSGDSAYRTGMDGIAIENPFFGDGPGGEFDSWAITSRVFQWKKVAELPEYEYGFAAVPTPTGTDAP